MKIPYFQIARHQGCQKRLRKEIQSNVEVDGHLSFEKLNELPYLEMCLNEALRTFPPILYSTKLCTEECELINKNRKPVVIPSGCGVVISSYAIHHDEDHYPNPESFNPERFKDGAQKFIDKGVFLPFGLGPRKCLGIHYANVQIKAVVVEIIRNFKIKVNSNTRTDNKLEGISYVAALDGGVWLDFEPIKKTA